MLTVTHSNKFTVSYGDIRTDDHMYFNTLVFLECWRQDYLSGSVAIVVNLSKGITYLAILLVWCMSGCATYVYLIVKRVLMS